MNTKKRITTIRRVSFISIFIFVIVLSLPLYVKYSSRHKIFVNTHNVENMEFAIVLGAGIKKNGEPDSYLKRR